MREVPKTKEVPLDRGPRTNNDVEKSGFDQTYWPILTHLKWERFKLRILFVYSYMENLTYSENPNNQNLMFGAINVENNDFKRNIFIYFLQKKKMTLRQTDFFLHIIFFIL